MINCLLHGPTTHSQPQHVVVNIGVKLIVILEFFQFWDAFTLIVIFYLIHGLKNMDFAKCARCLGALAKSVSVRANHIHNKVCM